MDRIRRTCDYCGSIRMLHPNEAYFIGKCPHCGDRNYTDKRIDAIDYYEGCPEFPKDPPDYEPY